MSRAEKDYTAINGVVEPDFLNYLQSTFKEWQRLAEQKTALGSRAISKANQIIEGARLNAHAGFTYHFRVKERETDGKEVIRLQIFTNCNKEVAGEPQYTFEAEIYK